MTSFEFRGRASVVCLAAALVACGSDAARGGGSEPAPEGSLCPSCLAGGETTDFAGDSECWGMQATAIERDSAIVQEFAVDELLARLAQPLRTTFGWRRRPGGSAAVGYERETEVELQVEVLGMSHGQWEGSGPRCGDFLLLDARVHLATSDGSLAGTFTRPLLLPRGASAATLSALGLEESGPQLALRDFTGSLDLGLDVERIYDGTIGLELTVGPEALQGRLGVYIWYRDPDDSRWLFTPLQAQWPSDGCADGWQRIEPNAPIHPTDGRTARDYFERSTARLTQAFPASASWLDAGQTEIELQPGELEHACQYLAQPAAYYLATPLQIRSADGRLETTQAAQIHFRTDDDSVERLTVEGEAVPRAGFAADVAVSDMAWSDASEATFELRSDQANPGAASGDLQVFGFGADGEVGNLLYLHWCSGSSCETYPRVRFSPGGLNGVRLP